MKKGFISIISLVATIALVAILGAGFYYQHNKKISASLVENVNQDIVENKENPAEEIKSESDSAESAPEEVRQEEPETETVDVKNNIAETAEVKTDDQKKIDEELKKAEEARKQAEIARKKAEEEQKKLQEQARIAEENRVKDEAKKQTEEAKRKEEENNRIKEQQRVEAERIAKEQEAKRLAEEQETKNLDISNYLTSVGEMICWNNNEKVTGTGFLMRYWPDSAVFTNKHIFEGKKECIFNIGNLKNDLRGGHYYIDAYIYNKWNSDTDFGFFIINNESKNKITGNDSSYNIEDLNYSIAALPFCPENTKQGNKVYVIGYPSYNNGIFDNRRTVTEGIISGYKSYILKDDDFIDDYYISNKIDSGNSGSPALSIENNKFCLLGIVTWLSVGNYESQGIVQNIHNIYLKR